MFNKKTNTKSIKGQAMVETLISTVFLVMLVIASIQFVILVVNELVANEAAFAISRVAVVSKENEVNSKSRAAFLYILGPQTDLISMSFVPYECPIRAREVQPQHTNNNEPPVSIYCTYVKFVSNILCGSFFSSGGNSLVLGGRNIFKSTSRASMVKSPDEDYYDKSYPHD